jgi:hypothetical protein
MPLGVTYTQQQYNAAEAVADAFKNSGGIPITGGGGGGAPVSRTPTIQSVTGVAGTIGTSLAIAVRNIGSAAGLVGGVSIGPGTMVSWAASESETLTGISYDATGTTFLITRVV